MPALVILGGVNGAGKTTLAEALARNPAFSALPFLNADVNAARIRRADPTKSITAANFLGLRDVAEDTAALLAARRSFITETVLASAANRALALRAREAGYAVRLLYVGIGAIEDSIARVARRVAKGGHDVPEKDLRRRWAVSHDNLAWFVTHADEVRVFDNRAYGQRPHLIAHARAGRLLSHIAGALPEVDRVLAGL